MIGHVVMAPTAVAAVLLAFFGENGTLEPDLLFPGRTCETIALAQPYD